MSNVDNIPGNDDTVVRLSYEDFHDGWHCNGDLEEDSLERTDTAERLANVILDPDLRATSAFNTSGALLVRLREQGMLDSYERGGDYEFHQHVTDQIKENFMQLDDLIECSIEQWDYKRGRCTVTAQVRATLGRVKESPWELRGWTATVEHNGGSFSVEL